LAHRLVFRQACNVVCRSHSATKPTMPAAKALKRTTSEATTNDAKRKKVMLEPAVEAQCGLVKAALATAPALPAEVVQMMNIMLPLTLGECKDKRHPYQSRVIDAIAEVLQGVETGLKVDLDSAQSNVQSAETMKEKRGEEVAQASDDVVAKDAAMQEKKLGLADEAAGFRDMRNALHQAEAKQTEVESELKLSGERLEEVRTALGVWLAPLKGNGAEPLSEGESAALRTKLLAYLDSKDVEIDESLTTALPAALEKTPDARGPFDAMAIQELDTVLGARLAKIEQEVQDAEPTRVEQANAVRAALAARDESAGKLRESAAAFSLAKANHQEGEASLANTWKARSEVAAEVRNVARVLDRASGRLGKFQEGALHAFNELCERRQVQGGQTAPTEDSMPEGEKVQEPVEALQVQASILVEASVDAGEN